MKKTAVILVILTLATKVLGFIRDITLSYFYGATNITDAYLISITIPTIIFAFIGMGIATSFIPVYSRINDDYSIQSADRFTNNIVNWLLVICTFIILGCFVFTVPVVKLFASGFEGEALSLAVVFTRINLLGIYFSVLVYVFKSYLQLKNSFIPPALMGIPLNLFIIISIVLSAKFNIIILAIGSVIALAAQGLFLLPFVYKKGYKYKFILDINDENLKKMVFLSLPVIISVSVNQINVLIDRTIASQIAIGGISALNYANRLNLFIQGIFVTSIATAMYPMISKMAAEGNIIGLKKTIKEAITIINLLVIPATIGAVIFAEPIVNMLFGRGAFDKQAIIMTSYALLFYSIGMVAVGLREILSRAFYSLQDTKSPMGNAVIAMVINIILNIILSRFLGIGGLALATSISAIICTALMFMSLKKKIGSFGIKNIAISFIKILCVSSVMGIISKTIYSTLFSYIGKSMTLVISIGVGAIVYFCLIYFMKIDEVDTLVNIFKNKLKKVIAKTN